MEKKKLETKKTSALALHKETLGRLDESKLRGAAGAAKIWIPAGVADDTTPIYRYEDLP